jgi:hypothetical protein
MQELILKRNIPPIKMEALLYFLKSWNIEVELRNIPTKPKVKVKKIDEATLMSEQALAKEWLSKEEDEAWKNL